MYFPNICVDNFFNNPDEIRNFALNLEYFSCNKNESWPGTRTKNLYEVAPNYYSKFCIKLLNIFFDLKNNDHYYEYEVDTYFQLLKPNEYGSIDTGWIHQDPYGIMSGVIYLTPNISIDCGTSIFKLKDINSIPINNDIKNEMYSNFDKEKIDVYKKALTDNNKNFYEIINYKNIYNRLIAFDAGQFHGVNKTFINSNDYRLTQVFFIKKLNSHYFPIPEMKQILL